MTESQMILHDGSFYSELYSNMCSLSLIFLSFFANVEI